MVRRGGQTAGRTIIILTIQMDDGRALRDQEFGEFRRGDCLPLTRVGVIVGEVAIYPGPKHKVPLAPILVPRLRDRQSPGSGVAIREARAVVRCNPSWRRWPAPRRRHAPPRKQEGHGGGGGGGGGYAGGGDACLAAALLEAKTGQQHLHLGCCGVRAVYRAQRHS